MHLQPFRQSQHHSRQSGIMFATAACSLGLSVTLCADVLGVIVQQRGEMGGFASEKPKRSFYLILLLRLIPISSSCDFAVVCLWMLVAWNMLGAWLAILVILLRKKVQEKP